jgi:hypothetical protein
MKLTTIIGTAIAATGAPTLAPTVAPTPTATPTGSGVGAWSEHTTCAPAGGEGSIVFNFTGVWDSESGTYPNFITIDGINVPVTSTTFEQAEAIGLHHYTLNINSDFTIVACPDVTVTATCSQADNPSGIATFTGVTVGDYLNVGDSTYSTLITSNPFNMNEMPNAQGLTFVETNGDTTVFSGTLSVAACIPVPITGAGL